MTTYDPETGEVLKTMTVIPQTEPAQLMLTGIQFEQDITFEQWSELGAKLQFANSAIHWWLGDWQNYGEKRWGEQYAQALDETPFAYQTLRNDAWIAGSVDLSVRTDKLSFGHHQLVAKMEQDQQSHWLQLAIDNEWSISDLRKAIKQAELDALPPLPAGMFEVIYADPAWEFSNTWDNTAPDNNQSAQSKYLTVNVDEICKMEVKDRAAENAVLFLWGVASQMPEAIRVMEAWGFEYKTCMIWNKNKAPGMGWWVHTYHEVLLIGERGSFKPQTRPNSVVAAPVTKHSRKPDEFYAIIEQMYPDAKYLELFARRPRDGWSSYGNELPMPEMSKEEKVA